MAFLTINNMRSSYLERKIPFNVCIPFDSKLYPHPKGEKFKTLYLLHGLRDNLYTWPLHTRIYEFSEKYNIAVVMPSGENSYYLDRHEVFENYEKFIGEELIERSRILLPLSDKREDTFIGGFSMGGYGALHNGLKYNDTFSKIIAFSPSMELERPKPDEDGAFPRNLAYLESHYHNMEEALVSQRNPFVQLDTLAKEKKDIPSIYMCTGLSDPIMREHRMLEAKYKECGVDYTAVETEGAHEWDFINRNLEDALKWLLK